MDIYQVLNVMDDMRLSAQETLFLHTIIVRLNKNYWQPVELTQDIVGRGMHKETFFTVRKQLVKKGLLSYSPGTWKTATPVYNLGPKLIQDNRKPKEKMKSREEIKKLVIEIDRRYPDFSGLCAKHKWDKAVELFKAQHPELHTTEWPVDNIGDPVNRDQAHEMLVTLHKRKKSASKKRSTTKTHLPEAWISFTAFVDMWRVTYPKKSVRALLMNAVQEFIKGKEDWSADKVQELQARIGAHTTAYINSFGGDLTYMVSPVNYFASEKWTERVCVKQDKTDVNSKTAGAPATPNMPKITTIKVNSI